MLTLLNIGIIVLLLAMIAIWATYGFFSAFLHLIIVIIAGVFTLAVWEPLSYMLLGTMPAYAHGVGLLAPFAVLIIVLRALFDKLFRSNVHMPHIADQIGGGACGFCSGVLAFGMLLNGANFLPLDREVMGWEPYKVRGNEVTENPDGQLWTFTRINQWSAGFYSMLSTGSMSPIGGTPLAVGRPELAKRAVLTRLPADENQFRTAHPGSVKVTGVYTLPATEEAIRDLAQRAAVLPFLRPSYKLPEDIDYGETGMGLVNAILDELNKRFEDPQTHGRPSDMIDIAAIMGVSRTERFKFTGAASSENFPQFIQMVAEKMGDDLVERLKNVTAQGKTLYVVDTFWNNEYPGTFNTDGKLRVAIPQVSLQTGQGTVAPIGYSIEYSQNTRGRTFTEIISDQADVAMRDAAYSKYTELHIGWVFALPEGQTPEGFMVRELRFNLDKLDKPEGQDSRFNQNIGAVAHVIGAPLLPAPADETDAEERPATNDRSAQGVKILGSDAYAEVSEALPGAFSGSAVNLDFDKDSDPWKLKVGANESLARGRGGNRSTVREIWTLPSDRLVRINLDAQKATSLYGRALGRARSFGVMRVQDEGGNFYSAVGFALLKADNTMHINIRSDAVNRGLSANDLPDVRPGETLMLYFQVPIGTNLAAYVVGDEEQRFEQTLIVGERSRR